MGQTTSYETNPTTYINTPEKMVLRTFGQIEKDIKECTAKLAVMKTQDVQELDIETLRKQVTQEKDKFVKHIEFLDVDGVFRKETQSNVAWKPEPKIKTYTDSLFEELEKECSKWTTIIKNLTERNELFTDKFYVMSELKVTEETLHKLSQVQIKLVKVANDSSLPNPPDKTGDEQLGVDENQSSLKDVCVEQLMIEIETLKKSNEDMQKSFDVLQTDNKKLRASGKEATSETEDLKSSNEHLKSQIKLYVDKWQSEKENNEEQTEQLKQYRFKSERLTNQVDQLIAEQNQLQEQIRVSTENYTAIKQEHNELTQQVDNLKQLWEKEKKRNSSLSAEREDMLMRLSKVAGEKLTQENPSITDLSDKHRPTKLGEMYSELYDNEWTDAFDGMKEAGHTDQVAIETLKKTLLHTYEFCSTKSKLVREQMMDAANLLFEEQADGIACDQAAMRMVQTTMATTGNAPTSSKVSTISSLTLDDMKLHQKWKPVDCIDTSIHAKPKAVAQNLHSLDVANKIKKMEKEIADSMILSVQQAYIQRIWDDSCIPELMPFIGKCLYIGWMMVVQSPPLCFEKDPSQGDTFDTSTYRQYVTCGKCVDYVVWPALLLHESGAVVCKGVAEARK